MNGRSPDATGQKVGPDDRHKHRSKNTARVAVGDRCGLVLLIAVLWIGWDRDTDAAFATDRTGPTDSGATRIPATAATAGSRADSLSGPVPAEVAAYRSFAESSGTSAAGLSHDYAATGIRRLSEALRAVAGSEVATNEQFSQQLAIFQEKADRLQADPSSLGHANIVREVFVSAVDVMGSIQESRSSGSTAVKNRVAELRQVAESIEGGRPLLEQEARVARFFNDSAETLTMLAER